MKNKLNNTIRIIIGLTIGFILVAIWFNIVDFNELVYYFSNANVVYVVPAVIFYLFSYFIRSERLRKLLSIKKHIPILKNYSYALAGNFLNYFIPIRAGEIAKCIFYKRNHDIAYSESAPSVIIDKIFDTFAIFVVLLLIPLTGIELYTYLNLLIILLIIVFIIGFSIVFLISTKEKDLANLFKKILFVIPKKYNKKIERFINLFVKGLAIFKHNKQLLLPSLILTFAATISDSLFFYFMFNVFGIEISFIKILFGYTLIFLSYSIPHPPAQIGSNQMIMLAIFYIGFGYDKIEVSAVMTFAHLITATVILITGTLCLFLATYKEKNKPLI